MGCVSSSHEDKTSHLIDRQLARDAAEERSFIKLLLLGSGDSGKSTIMKQVKILHRSGFTEDELHTFKPIIFQNIFSAMNVMVEAMAMFAIPFEDIKNVANANIIGDVVVNESLQDFIPSEVYRNALSALWQDRGVKECFSRSDEYQLEDSVEYFFSNLQRIFCDDYMPSEEDILRLRVRTTGIIEAPFQVSLGGKTLSFKLIDVGGQRSERRKWIHCFEDVSTILFVVAISEYNQVLFEDGVTNRMEESLKLFESIVNNAFFRSTNFILFLNKVDIFEEKIQRFPITSLFPEFEGSLETAKNFIAQKYLSKVKTPQGKKSRKVYHHFTCATNTDQVKQIFEDVVEIIILRNLQKTNLV